MRALPIIVDLFVLLTIFALVLFYAALGNSAPNQTSSQLTLIEVSANLFGGPGGSIPADGLIGLEAQLVNDTGVRIADAPIEVPHPDPGMRRFLIRTAPEESHFRLVITSISPVAFQSQSLALRAERLYPGRAVADSIEQVGRANIVSIPVQP